MSPERRGVSRTIVSVDPGPLQPATELEERIAAMLYHIQCNYEREGTGVGSRFQGERLEIVQARAVIRELGVSDGR